MSGATMVEEVIHSDEQSATVRLQCGHTVSSDDPTLTVGRLVLCPECAARPPVVDGIPLASGAQLDAITEEYARHMRLRGFTIGEAELAAIRRSAAIQDVWRAAFARVMGPSVRAALAAMGDKHE